MKPYDSKFLIEKMEQYNNAIKECNMGDFKISKQSEKMKSGYLYEKDEKSNIEVTRLFIKDEPLMSVDPKEIQGSYEAIKWAKGKVGIVGLGLGYVVQEMAKKDEVTEIIVYEISNEVIEFYNRNFSKNEKIKIIKGDAFKAKKESFDFFFVDIYEYELTDRVVEDYKRFNEIHNIEEYSFWGMEHFLLSCRYEEIVWVFIPEIWMDMAKDLSRVLEESGYIKYYKNLNEDLVSNVLKQFKVILNDGEEEYMD